MSSTNDTLATLTEMAEAIGDRQGYIEILASQFVWLVTTSKDERFKDSAESLKNVKGTKVSILAQQFREMVAAAKAA